MRALNNLKDPTTEIYKIVDTETSEILGFACMSISDGKGAYGVPSNPGGNFEPPAGFNIEFGMKTATGLAKIEECMKGQKHMGRFNCVTFQELADR